MKKLLLSLLYAVLTILVITTFALGLFFATLYYPIPMLVFFVLLMIGSVWAAFYSDMG